LGAPVTPSHAKVTSLLGALIICAKERKKERKKKRKKKERKKERKRE